MRYLKQNGRIHAQLDGNEFVVHFMCHRHCTKMLQAKDEIRHCILRGPWEGVVGEAGTTSSSLRCPSP